MEGEGRDAEKEEDEDVPEAEAEEMAADEDEVLAASADVEDNDGAEVEAEAPTTNDVNEVRSGTAVYKAPCCGGKREFTDVNMTSSDPEHANTNRRLSKLLMGPRPHTRPSRSRSSCARSAVDNGTSENETDEEEADEEEDEEVSDEDFMTKAMLSPRPGRVSKRSQGIDSGSTKPLHSTITNDRCLRTITRQVCESIHANGM